MLDQHTEELIHAVVDGEVDAESVAELERRAAAEPEVHAALEEVRILVDTLAAMPAHEPPAALHRTLRGRPAEPPKGALISLLSKLAGAKALRYSYAFTAGILATVIVLQLGRVPGLDDASMVGAMAPAATGQELVLDGIAVGIRTTRDAGLVRVGLDVQADHAAEIEAVFGVDQVRLAGFSSDDGPTPTLEVRPGRMTATVIGSQHFSVMLEPIGGSAAVVMTLRTADGAAVQQVVRISGGG